MSLSPEASHYFRLFDRAAGEWSAREGALTKAASLGRIFGRAGKASKGVDPSMSLNELRRLVLEGKIDPKSLDPALIERLSGGPGIAAAMGKHPLKSVLGAGAVGGILGYGSGKDTGEESSRSQAAAGFGAGMATGLAAPSILEGLNQIVSNQGLMPGSGYGSDYYTQI